MTKPESESMVNAMRWMRQPSKVGRVASQPARIDGGTSCPTQSANFAQLTQLTLTAQADAGSTFMGWSGGGCLGIGDCQLAMGTDPVTVTAQFVRQQAAVPTFLQWGLIIFGILTAASALTVIRRRQHS